MFDHMQLVVPKVQALSNLTCNLPSSNEEGETSITALGELAAAHYILGSEDGLPSVVGQDPDARLKSGHGGESIARATVSLISASIGNY